MGSFSDWQPVELEGGERGWWRAELPLAAGIYEINVRFDGGPWQVPDGAATAADGFGGQVGVFTVDAGS
jgi:1,4-alpha-glucan branching enzyme